MEQNFDYNSVPFGYLSCINATCNRAGKCLRHQVYLRTPTSIMKLQIVNPASVAPDGHNCTLYQEDCLQSYALGMNTLYDKLPHAAALRIKSDLLATFGKSKYYRLMRGERYISPSEQQFIRNVFIRAGITEIGRAHV